MRVGVCVVGQVVGLHFLAQLLFILFYRSSKPIIFDVLVHTILTYIYIFFLIVHIETKQQCIYIHVLFSFLFFSRWT